MRKKWPAILLVCLFQTVSLAAQKPNIHRPWQQILTAYVSNGVVNYSDLKEEQTDWKKLDAYLDALGKADIRSFSREELLAFWINAYNAFTVKLILDHYPVGSIKDIPNAWEQKVWHAAGQLVSLNDIEQIKLRRELNEPRMHFAIVCASRGCPDLRDRAFRVDNVNKMLDESARSFFRQLKNFRMEQSSSIVTLFLSQIFQWYGSDFGKTDKERIAFICTYLPKDAAATIIHAKKVEIKYLDYDWSLNGM